MCIRDRSHILDRKEPVQSNRNTHYTLGSATNIHTLFYRYRTTAKTHKKGLFSRTIAQNKLSFYFCRKMKPHSTYSRRKRKSSFVSHSHHLLCFYGAMTGI